MSQKILTWKQNPGDAALLERIELTPTPGSLDEGTRLIPAGGYTTLRTYPGGRVLQLRDHFLRLEETASLAGKAVAIGEARLRHALQQVQEEYPAAEIRIRIVLDLEFAPGTLYYLAEELTTPAEAEYQHGVRAVTRRMQRQNPKAKLTGFIAQAAQVRHDLPGGINEALMIGASGEVLEGLSSNFFGVKAGVVFTAEEGVLFGITRSMVIEVIQDLGIPLVRQAVAEKMLPELDEVFITSASRAVLPVCEIDGCAVGSGQPGPVTLAILTAYRSLLDARLEAV